MEMPLFDLETIQSLTMTFLKLPTPSVPIFIAADVDVRVQPLMIMFSVDGAVWMMMNEFIIIYNFIVPIQLKIL